MSTTANDVFMLALAFAGDLDENNQPDDVDDLAVYTPHILTALQAELIKSGDIFSTYEIANKPATNMLGYSSGHDYAEFIGDEITRECSGSVKAYYFEVSDNATVYVEDYTGSWNTLATITAEPTASGYTAYKGLVTPTAGATKSRLRFAGTYRYIFTNYAMFSVLFASVNEIPTYRPWFKVTMPSDFKSLDQVVNEYPQRQYGRDSNFKWEGRGDLYINYYYEGNIRIVYRPVPGVITALTDVLQVDDVSARSILPWGLAAELYKSDETKYKHFLNRYKEMKALSMLKQPVTESAILDMYGGI